MIPIAGFAPDADQTSPGVLVDVSNMVPTVKGMTGAKAKVDAGLPALADSCKGFVFVSKLDGTRRIFAGTSSAMYEATSGAWVDRSKGGGYSIGTDRWSFAQFGDVTLAAAKNETLQSSTTGAFADVSGAPKMNHIAVSSGFVMGADTNDGTFGDQADRWWCSAYLDYTDWTPSVATQCVSGRLVDSPGAIRALKALGSSFVAYKETSIYLANYVGAPSVWSWQKMPGDVGVISNDVVVNVGFAHLFIGMDDFYIFDGTRPVSIGSPVREWFFANVSTKDLFRTQGAYDRITGNVYWFYVPRSNTSSTLNAALVYNVKTQKWGKLTMSVEAVSEYLSEGVSYNDIGTLFTTYDDLPRDVSFDSPYWTAEQPVIAVIDGTHTLYTLTGDSVSCSLTTGAIGDDDQFNLFRAVRPRFVTAPSSSTLEIQYDNDYGDSFTPDGTVNLVNGRYDFLHSARWHRFVISFSGAVTVSGFTYDVKPEGFA